MKAEPRIQLTKEQQKRYENNWAYIQKCERLKAEREKEKENGKKL